MGADVVVLPTNWPKGAVAAATFLAQARAFENKVYYMPVNRVGTERGFQFIGQSKVCNPLGEYMTQLNETEEGILIAEIDPARARDKQVVRIPGKYELNYFKDRRPEHYQVLVES
jgi:predicted amidohydrolase